MRNLSALKKEREAASGRFAGRQPGIDGSRGAFLARLKNAVYAGTILTYSHRAWPQL